MPAVILSNVHSLQVKMDELEVNVWYMQVYREVCLLVFTETWLDRFVHDHELTTVDLDHIFVLTATKQRQGESRVEVCVFM